jgi:hypothetical protein
MEAGDRGGRRLRGLTSLINWFPGGPNTNHRPWDSHSANISLAKPRTADKYRIEDQKGTGEGRIHGCNNGKATGCSQRVGRHGHRCWIPVEWPGTGTRDLVPHGTGIFPDASQRPDDRPWPADHGAGDTQVGYGKRPRRRTLEGPCPDYRRNPAVRSHITRAWAGTCPGPHRAAPSFSSSCSACRCR